MHPAVRVGVVRSVGGGAAVSRAVVLGWSVPPIDSSLSRRTADLVAALSDAGCLVTVITVDSPAAVRDDGLDAALARRIPDDVRILRIADDHPDELQRIDRWSHERALDPAGWRDEWLARAAAQFDEPGFGHVHDRMREEALRVADTDGVDLVVAVAAPMVTVAVAADVSARHGADLVVDLARTTAGDFEIGGQRVRDALSRATVWCPDEGTRARLGDVDPAAAECALVVPDGFGAGLEPGAAVPARREHWPLRVGCFVEPDAWSAFVEVVEGWIAARGVHPVLTEATLAVFGRPPATSVAPSVLAQAASAGVVAEASPSVDDLPEVHRGLDLVVVVSRGDLPAGRTADHLAAGVPVVWCTAQRPGPDHPFEEASQVVRAVDLSPHAITEAVRTALALDPATVVPTWRVSAWPAALEDLDAKGDRR